MNNSTANNYSARTHAAVSDTEKILFTSGLSILSIIAIFGNTLVIMSFFMSRPLRTYTNYFIVSLSLSDISVAAISMPIWITFITLNRNFGILDGKLLKVWTCFDIMTGVASIWNLTAVSVDRYVHVTRPLTHPKLITKRRVLTVIILIWFFSFGISFLKWFYFDWEKPNYEVLVTVVGFFVPLFVIIFSYVRIYGAVKNQLGKFTGQSKLTQHRSRLNADLKAIKTIALVVLAFCLCWSPFFILNLWNGLCQYKHRNNVITCKLDSVLISFVKWLHYFNSGINPIIYACFNREFRNGFKIALYKKLSSSESGPFSSILNRTSFRETLTPVHDPISPKGKSRNRSRTTESQTVDTINTDNEIVKKQSVTFTQRIANGTCYHSKVATKVCGPSLSTSENGHLLCLGNV